MSTRSGRTRQSIKERSPLRTRRGISPSNSSVKTQKSSPVKRSPSRRSPRKSPSRKTTSDNPVRKSPSRSAKNKAENDTENVTLTKSPSKRQTQKEILVSLNDIGRKSDLTRTTRSRRLENSAKDLTDTISITSNIDKHINGDDSEVVLETTEQYNLRNRRSDKLREMNFAEKRSITKSLSKSVSKSVSESASQSIDTNSDEEKSQEIMVVKSETVIRKLSTPSPDKSYSKLKSNLEFGGRFGSLAFIVIIPLVTFSILLLCKNNGKYDSLLQPSLYEFKTWFDTTASLLVIVQYGLQGAFVFLPTLYSKEVSKVSQHYSFNGVFCTFGTMLIIIVLHYCKKLNGDILLELPLQMALQSYIIAVVLSLILYIRKSDMQENFLPYGNTQYSIYSFFMGKELQPTLLKINIKLWVSRVANISALILSLWLLQCGVNFQENIENISLKELYNLPNIITLKSTLVTFSLMQLIYSVYFILNEDKMTSTFYWQHERIGYLQLVSSACYPYYFVITSMYIQTTNLTLSKNMLIAAFMLFLLGFVIMHSSNYIKAEFRKNPLHPRVLHLDSMPTLHGKKLLVSNVWGYVRHPNYTGDILIQISLALPGIYTKHFVAAIPALLTILVLIHRSWRDHGNCKRRYGPAWQRYCKRVPSIFIPKIF